MVEEKKERSTDAGGIVASLHDAVTGRWGFPVFLTLVMTAFWLLRVSFPEAPANADVKEQLWLSVGWKLGYSSGANPPLFNWLVVAADGVLGTAVPAVELVRFALLWLFCYFSAEAFRGMTSDARLGALAGLAPLSVFAVGWEALFRHSNTMLLMAAIAMTLFALQRLDRRNDAVAYLFFGLATAVGFYSKYNYAVVWIGFLAAAMTDERLRRRLLDRRMVAALLLALLLLAPLLYWVAGHIDGIVGHGRMRMNEKPAFPALPGQMSALLDLAAKAAGLVLPLFAILLVLCPRAFRRPGSAGGVEPARWGRLVGRYVLIVAAILVVAVFVSGMTRFQARYVYVLLPVLSLAFLRLAAAGISVRRRQWLAAALVAVIVLVIAGTAYRGVTYGVRKTAAAPQSVAWHLAG